MSIGPSFDTGILRIRLKAAEDKVKAFESGEKYVRRAYGSSVKNNHRADFKH